MWTPKWRQQALERLSSQNEVWDILIIGGGITGAGIFYEAARHNLKVLLVEQKDFGWGTSSRSSKLIHGGLRYLFQGDLTLTWHAAREREFLLKKYPKLIEPLSFIFPIYKDHFPGKWATLAGLTFYDLLAWHRHHDFWDRSKTLQQIPMLNAENLVGAGHFFEATTDDARLVLQILREGTKDDAIPLNYVTLKGLAQDNKGAILKEAVSGQEYRVKSRLIINATGVWADSIRESIHGSPRLRPLRGSHLIFPIAKLPLQHAVSFLHPEDRRPIFAYPWEGVTLVGTTDLDQKNDLNREPRISEEELEYLLNGLHAMFPDIQLTDSDIISTFAGLRSVVSSGKKKPSRERRDTAIWVENGLLTVTGGKLTTFRLTARDVLKTARQFLPELALLPPETVDTHSPIPSFEMRTALLQEGVIHLDDLLLRRTRLGLTNPNGAKSMLKEIIPICQEVLGWDENRCNTEINTYTQLWQQSYYLPWKSHE